MGLFKNFFVAGMVFLSASTSTMAQEHGTKEEAVALAQAAIAYYKKNGLEKTLVEVNGKSDKFRYKDLYVFIADLDGTMLAHGDNARIVGKSMALLKDADGNPFAFELLKIVQAGSKGWANYKWPNPVTKGVDDKTTYVESYDKLGFAVGIYK
ncbi:cache domain-containing protein [Noviherbaspirillum saxi]|uniref:Histidine kinase n=1 Tax=Noviherbaspirillum saxi TaxID=2320863 RepID=A0A3A3FUP6_9BURK|nr:cache domain-containing protein [Noviherbaspirillum saxi]RJF99776.1 histidine kinase [Noviherbaspirillum saxi]